MQSKDQKMFSSNLIIGRSRTMSIQQEIKKNNCKQLMKDTKATLKFTAQVIDEFYSRRMADICAKFN